MSFSLARRYGEDDPDRMSTIEGFKQADQALREDEKDMAHVANLMFKSPIYRNQMERVAEITHEKGKISEKQKSEFVNWLHDMAQMGAEGAASETMRQGLNVTSEAGTAISGAAGGIASIGAVIQGAMEISNSDDPAIQAEAAVNVASGAAGGAAAALDLTATVLGAAPVPGARVLAGISFVLGGLARGVGAIVKDITIKKHYEHHNQGTENLFDGNRAQENDNWYRGKYESHGVGYFKNNDRVFGPNIQEKPEFQHLKKVVLHATKMKQEAKDVMEWQATHGAHIGVSKKEAFKLKGDTDLMGIDFSNFEPEELLETTNDPQIVNAINHLRKRHLQFKTADKQGGPSGWLVVKDDKWHEQAQRLQGMIEDKKHIKDEIHEDYQRMQKFLKSRTIDELKQLKKSDAWHNRAGKKSDYGFDREVTLAKDGGEIAKWSPNDHSIDITSTGKWGRFV